MWLRGVVGVLFAGALGLGLIRFGAVEPQDYLAAFLLLTAITVLAVCSFPLDALRQKRFILLFVVGLFLLSQVTLRETLHARGYVVACLGWLALILTLMIAAASEKAARWLYAFLVIAGSFQALYGLCQALGAYDYIGSYYRGQGRIATGTFINRNHYAGLLNMTLPLAVGWLFARFSQKASVVRAPSELYAFAWVTLLGCSLMGLAILLSVSRAGLLVLVSGLLFVSLLLVLNRRTPGRKLSAAVGWILLFTILGLGSWMGLDTILARLVRTDSSLEGRTSVFRDTLRLIGQSPVFGIGPGMYEWRFRPYQTSDARILFSYAHNDYLQSATEWGIPGALLFWAFVVRRWYRSVSMFLKSRHPWRQGIALGCSASIFAILLHSFVDFNLQIPANLMVFCTVLGLSWSIELQREAAHHGQKMTSP